MHNEKKKKYSVESAHRLYKTAAPPEGIESQQNEKNGEAQQADAVNNYSLAHIISEPKPGKKCCREKTD